MVIIDNVLSALAECRKAYRRNQCIQDISANEIFNSRGDLGKYSSYHQYLHRRNRDLLHIIGTNLSATRALRIFVSGPKMMSIPFCRRIGWIPSGPWAHEGWFVSFSWNEQIFAHTEVAESLPPHIDVGAVPSNVVWVSIANSASTDVNANWSTPENITAAVKRYSLPLCWWNINGLIQNTMYAQFQTVAVEE